MSAVVIEIRPFQSAVKWGRKLGITQQQAVHQVSDSIRQGTTGWPAAGQIQHAATRGPQPPKRA